MANLGSCTCSKASLVGEDNSEDCLQEEGHCCVDAKDQSIVLMFHMSGDLNSAVVQVEHTNDYHFYACAMLQISLDGQPQV